MDEALYQDLRQRFAAWGYDPATILRVPQRADQVGQLGFQ
jgi:apolipoprotein D and lipocalin family protein